MTKLTLKHYKKINELDRGILIKYENLIVNPESELKKYANNLTLITMMKCSIIIKTN